MLGIADSVIGVAGKVLDKFVGDKDLKVKLEAELNKELISLDLAQAQANIEQAKHPSIFVSGARPAIMWVCCFALAWQFIFAPILSWIIVTWYPMITLPMLETNELVSLIMALTWARWYAYSREVERRTTQQHEEEVR